jgi:FkbM family methyltransferase
MSLAGMNIGSGTNYETSGEISVIKMIARNFSADEKIVVFDVGANVGGYSKILNKYFPNKATIYLFEPSSSTFAKLKKNVGSNNRIVPINLGFSNKNEKRFLFSDQKESGLASVYHRRLNHLGIDMKHKELVQMTTIDKFCKENEIKRIHFLKIDVEGHEISVLEGAQKILSGKRIDYIQFEFGGCDIDSRTFLQDFFYLFGDDYHIHRIVKNGIYDLGAYKEYYECFVTTNYLAILKHDKG